MTWQPTPRGRPHKPRTAPRPITITWACGCPTKSYERDPLSRRELRSLAKREACASCRRLASERRRRDVGSDLDEDEFANIDQLFHQAPMSADEGQLILAGGAE
jgi:hypothetical protein